MPAKYKVLVTSTSFNKVDPLPRERLIQYGCEIVDNPFNRPLKEKDLIPLLEDVDGVIAGLDEYSRKAIFSSKKLKVISRYGVGLDNINLEAARDRGISRGEYSGGEYPGCCRSDFWPYVGCLPKNTASTCLHAERELGKTDWTRGL